MDSEDARCAECGRREGPSLNFRGRAVQLLCMHDGTYETEGTDLHVLIWANGLPLVSIEHAAPEGLHYISPM